MRLLLFITLQLSLWVSGLHAFFPFYPDSRCDEDPGCITEKKRDAVRTTSPSSIEGRTFKLSQRASDDTRRSDVSQIVSRARRKYAKKGAPISTESFERRADSIYSIIPATPPTLPHSEGVNQDGTDFSYFVEIGIGSNKKPIYMLIDTGAGTTWVMSSTCKSSPCSTHQTFGAPDSNSLTIEEDNAFEIHYGSGSVSGLIAKDTFHIAGFDMEFQFGLANVTSDDFNHFPFDGILGLGMTKGKSENFVQEIISEDLLEKNLFGVYLNRAADGDTGGEISFGAVNPEKYTGDITYTKLADQEHGDWAINMGDFAYGDKKAGVSTTLAYIDTGTSYAFGPKSEVAKIFALIDGASSKDGITYSVPCDSDAEVTVSFSGRKFVISAKDWLSRPNSAGVCTGNFYGIEVVKDAWLLGDVFLKNVYAVFDADNKQIGFATRPAVTRTSTAGSAISTSPPGTVTQGSDDTTTTAVADTAMSPGSEPTGASGVQLGSNVVYTVVCVVAVIAAVAS